MPDLSGVVSTKTEAENEAQREKREYVALRE
jgi:hypothetical protein